MPTDAEVEKTRREAAESPAAWFVVLERARKVGDFELAARAVRELGRLGVTVKFRRGAPGASHD